MALSRCLEQHSPPKGRVTEYRSYAEPVGYPETALVCGIRGCTNPGVIWLDYDEVEGYEAGMRVISGPNNFTKMRAADSGLRQIASRR